MAISRDSSTPSAPSEFAGTSTATSVSGSFSPPAGSLVVVLVGDDNETAKSAVGVTVADSLSNSYAAGPLIYNTDFATSAAFSFYYAAAPGAITVTATRSPASKAGVAVWPIVLDGVALGQAGAGNATNSGTSGTTITVSITTTTTGSTVLLIGTVSTDSETFTPNGSTTTLGSWSDTTDGSDFVFGQMTNPTGTPGPVTLGWTDGSSADWALVALEILPARTPAPPPPVMIPPGFSPMSFTLQPEPPIPPLPVFPVADTDIGSGADSGSTGATLGDTDAGAGADSAAVGVSSADAGAGVDAGSVSASIPGADAGAGSDAATAGVSSAETGGGADSGSAVLGASGSDTGSGTDAASSSASLSSTDTGSGSDAAAVAAHAPAGADSGGGADAAMVTISSADSGTGSESGSQAAVTTVLWWAPDKISKSGDTMG